MRVNGPVALLVGAGDAIGLAWADSDTVKLEG